MAMEDTNEWTFFVHVDNLSTVIMLHEIASVDIDTMTRYHFVIHTAAEPSAAVDV